MNKTTPALSALAAAMLLAATDARAENGRAGWYGGLDLGMAMPHEMDTRGGSTDVPTNCDQHLPRATVNIDGRNEILPFPLSDPGCARGQDPIGRTASISITVRCWASTWVTLGVGYALRPSIFTASTAATFPASKSPPATRMTSSSWPGRESAMSTGTSSLETSTMTSTMYRQRCCHGNWLVSAAGGE